MKTEDDYLGMMPFTIIFIDPLHTDFKGSAVKLNAYLARHPLARPRLHQPQFAAKMLEMAAHSANMRVVVRKADAAVKRELHYVVRKGVFTSDEKMWAFINDPDNLALVKNQ
ncbi:hypothetical protein [Neisseria chenwenguii]|uniref:hypothetical protein n=1 Tax=Neisseria chenwenguii TaxID=1853278 RepID=UPI000F4F4AC0|nr:hypothetical protein [Neisseria chenwenguii]ROV56371.1 hypothetical protein EGS38_04970 [Neisseria chenwenguii]